MISRDLTTLEYIILGILSITPQSPYSVAVKMESGLYRWKSNSSSIYAAIKRLEKHAIVSGELESVSETQSRKVYSLTPKGEGLLDDWIMQPVIETELHDEHNIMLTKFVFAEYRLSREQTLTLLDNYAERHAMMDAKLRVLHDVTKESPSIHQKLVNKAIAMERIAHRRWIDAARREQRQESTANAMPDVFDEALALLLET